MTKETTPDFFEDRGRLAMELRDALKSLRSLFVAAVSLVITIEGGNKPGTPEKKRGPGF